MIGPLSFNFYRDVKFCEAVQKGALEKLRLLSAEDGFQQYLSDNFWSQ